MSTSARTQRGSGSSTGAGPAQPKRRMLSAGSTATGPGSVSIASATAAHPGGYRTGVTLFHAPHARSGSTAIGAVTHASATSAGRSRPLAVTTAPAAATA